MSKSYIDGKSVLVTGGTGSFGSRFVERILKDCNPSKVVVFSRDETKQFYMAQKIRDERVRFLLGDIRDESRLQRAFHGIDIVIHAAALKHVPLLEFNPFEAVQTNVMGAQNIINAAIDQKVSRVIALSTDKAVSPINLYGATKLCMEKLFISGNAYAGGTNTRFGVVRYGNVIGSRGSVLHTFREKRTSGTLPVTDERMTRFWITLDEGVDCCLYALDNLIGGEIYIPKIPSMKVVDFAKVVAPECKIDVVGIRPGEKLYEVLIADSEAPLACDVGKYYVIKPLFHDWGDYDWNIGESVPDNFQYDSNSTNFWIEPQQMTEKIEMVISKLDKDQVSVRP